MIKRDPNLHKGHRARVKKRIMLHGLDGMNQHQIAEAMLFFSIPQGDTNELAHTLVNACGGTIVGVLNTPYKKLLKINGIGEHTACFITMCRLVAQLYLKETYNGNGSSGKIQDSADLCDYFRRVFVGIDKEEIHCAAFNAEQELIGELKVAEGGFDGVSLIPRKIFDFAADHNSSLIAIAHNHTSGSCLPSHEDVEITAELVKHLRYFDIEISDHIIIGSEGAFSMRSSQYNKTVWSDV